MLRIEVAHARHSRCKHHSALAKSRLSQSLHVVHEGLVAEACAARCGVMAGKVPVARMVGTGLVETLDALEHQFDRCLHVLRTQHLDNLLVDLLDGEGLINTTDVVFIEH